MKPRRQSSGAKAGIYADGMNTPLPRLVLTASLALGVAPVATIGLAGCSTSGNKPAAQRTIDTLDTLQTTLQRGEDTFAALSTHLQTAVSERADHDTLPPNLEPQAWFKAFSKQRQQVLDLRDRLAGDLERFRGQRDAYVNAWEQDLTEISDPALRDLARKRRDRLGERLQDTQSNLAEVDQLLRPYLTRLNDLHRFLANDLTPVGFASLQGPLKSAATDAGVLGDRFDDLGLEVKVLGNDLGRR